MRKKLAAPDALTAVGAFVIILHGAVVRALDAFLKCTQTLRIQHDAATAAAVTATDKLRGLGPHGESIKSLDNMRTHGIQLFP
jgi:hypothetical protein